MVSRGELSVDLPVIPVTNGVLPRPDQGSVKGVFLDRATARLLEKLQGRSPVLLLPFLLQKERLYPVGVAVRTSDMWQEEVFIGERKQRLTALFAQVQGAGRFRTRRFSHRASVLVAEGVEELILDELRPHHPCVDGAGWQPLGGQTEMKSYDDLIVTLYGVDYEGRKPVTLQANLGGLLTPERAHTVEHAIIRALNQYGMCSPRTLAQAIDEESVELRTSVEAGYRLQSPQVFGVTTTGTCGNPLTQLAHFYLSQEVVKGIEAGESLLGSVEQAQRKVMSRLSEELELTTQSTWRVMQGLKKGMLHDDTPLDAHALHKVLGRFPVSPWH